MRAALRHLTTALTVAIAATAGPVAAHPAHAQSEQQQPQYRTQHTASSTSTGAAPVTAASGHITGPDVASWQHPNGAPIDWQRVRNSGQRYVFVKATEGTTYTNPYFAGDWSGSRAAGLYRGAYHFARPYTTPGSAAAQAQAFAKVIGDQKQIGTLPPVLDIEQTGGLSQTELVEWIRQFLVEAENLTGRKPMIYTYPNFWANATGNSDAFTDYPLWIAHYNVSAPNIGPWSRHAFWQYTASATVDGIASTGNTDLNRFNGSGTDLALTARDGTWGPAERTNTAAGPVGRPGRYEPIEPVRLADSRFGYRIAKRTVTGPVTFTMPSTIPANATGVVLDIHAVQPTGPGYLRAHATGTSPVATAVNYTGSGAVTALATTAMSSKKQVTITGYGSATHLVVDLLGYYSPDRGTGGHWNALGPARVVDTRFGHGAAQQPASGQLTITMPSSVPADAVVALDVSAVEPPGAGYVRLSRAGVAPKTTALNFLAGQSTTGLALTEVSASRQVSVQVSGSATDLVIDVMGYYTGSSTSGSMFVPVAPQRFIDTRYAVGMNGPGTGPVTVTVPDSVPLDATAVVLNVSVVAPNVPGYLRLTVPNREARTTSVNVNPGANSTNQVVAAVSGRKVTFVLNAAEAHLVVDLVAYQQ